MSGLENMKRQILDEANHSAEEQISKARTKAEEILREAREQMEEQSAVMAKKSEDETKDYAQRIASSSEMQRKQALLQAKQEVIQEFLTRHISRYCIWNRNHTLRCFRSCWKHMHFRRREQSIFLLRILRVCRRNLRT